MKYTVSMAVEGRIDVEVEADSFMEAKDKAITAFMDADLSGMDCVDSHPVNAESEDGGFYDY